MSAPCRESGAPAPGNRRFEPFLDGVDMVGFFPADATLDEVNRTAADEGLRFPLVLNPARSLREHLAASEFAPASSRFGPYTDNVLGMNWELPSGKLVQVGERVAKSSTGYDLLRFLLHGDARYGRATGYLLRLRPMGGERLAGTLAGAAAKLNGAAAKLRSSSWNHWIESIDSAVSHERPPRIECAVDCMPGERSRFADFFQSVARETSCSFEAGSSTAPADLPLLTIKTLPSLAPALAERCVAAAGGCARAILAHGAVLANPEQPVAPGLLDEWRAAAVSAGGHLFGRATGAPAVVPEEAGWADAILKKWESL